MFFWKPPPFCVTIPLLGSVDQVEGLEKQLVPSSDEPEILLENSIKIGGQQIWHIFFHWCSKFPRIFFVVASFGSGKIIRWREKTQIFQRYRELEDEGLMRQISEAFHRGFFLLAPRRANEGSKVCSCRSLEVKQVPRPNQMHSKQP